ncbi:MULTISPECIES: glycohydrolase toxin TNT-related protein [Listeria]|uniref:TNT domain-containing protein n=1 Tax=Listeria TaxID=1637 RepID=UPI001FC95573|nr:MULTISPECIES: glycohydrolase toxin TNT-related protein [Listeria]
MKDIHYQEDDFEKAKKSIGDLIGKGAWGKGAIDCLKDASKNLEEVEKDIRTYDSDGAISFQHTNQKAQYQELFEDFDVLYRFSDQIGEIVKNTIDRPFYEKLDDFVEGMRNLDATTFTTENRIGATRTSMEFVNSSTQKQVEVPKSKVSLDDLFSGSTFYADQMKAQFDAWKKTHQEKDVSRQDFQAAMLNSRAFSYTSIKDEQQKQEFWVNIAATVVIIGVAVFCPPAGLALGAVYGSLEMSTAITGKDWVSGRELDASERAMRGSFALFDVLPGVKALSGGVQTMRSGSRLASLSDTFVHGVKSAPTQLGDITKIGQTQIRTRIKSLKNVTQDALQIATQKGIQGLDKVGQTATTMKGSLNLPPRQNLALAGMGGIPNQVPSQITQGTENLKDILQKFDVNLSGKGKQADGIIKETSKVFEPEKVTLKNGETAYKSSRGELVRSPNFLDEAGKIKWPDADGFVCDSAGNPIKTDANLKAGQVIDRYGDSIGKFTSPVKNGKILDYNTRGLPYHESVKPYHQYEVTADINLENVNEAFNKLDFDTQEELRKVMDDYDLSFSDIANPQQGEIAEVFGEGGGIQIQLGTVVKWYEKLGLLKELN